MNLRDEAELFLDAVRSTLIDALPLASERDIETGAWLNADTNSVVGEFDAPVIHGAGQLESEVDSQDYSQLFLVIVRYELTSDSTGKFLAVERSKFELRVATSPGIRFEYERGYTSAPCAHIHYSGVTGLLSPALMQNFQGKSGNPRKKGRKNCTYRWVADGFARRSKNSSTSLSPSAGFGANRAGSRSCCDGGKNGCSSKRLPQQGTTRKPRQSRWRSSDSQSRLRRGSLHE